MITGRIVLAFALFVCILFPAAAIAQSGYRHVDVKARVLDLLFSLDVQTEPYFPKLILRFGDSNTQLVVVVYPPYPTHPGGRSEMFRYSLAGTGNRDLSQLISQIYEVKRDVSDEDIAEIAGKLKVDVRRSPIRYEGLDRYLNELKNIRISPILASRVALDEYSEYEFWYHGGQESVHYALTGPFKGDPQDRLVQWMLKFRADVPNFSLKPPVTPSSSKP